MSLIPEQRGVRVTVYPPAVDQPKTITLTYPLDPEYDELLKRIHDELPKRKVVEDRMHDHQPGLSDLRSRDGLIHNIWLVVADIADPHRGPSARRWSLRHWPGTDDRITGEHVAPSTKYPEHGAQQEYCALRIDELPDHTPATELSIAPRTRSDVVALDRAGTPTTAIEIQRSYLHEREAIRRDNAVARQSVPAFWIGNTDSRPPWASRLAWVGANRREEMAPRSWNVASGFLTLEYEACRPGSPIDCPDGRGWCGGRHLHWVPRGIVMDDLIHGLVLGDYVRFTTHARRGAVVVATPADRERWCDHHGIVLDSAQAESPQRSRQPGGLGHRHVPVEKLRKRVVEGLSVHIPAQRKTCTSCGEPLHYDGFELHPGCYFREHLGWNEL